MASINRPKSTILEIDASNNIVSATKAYANPGGHVVFVVVNEDNRSHVVRIPTDEFVPDPPDGLAPGKPHPMDPLAIHWTIVDAHDAAVIRLKARGAGHFEAGNWTYKYTVYWADDIFGTNEKNLDPQIEINN